MLRPVEATSIPGFVQQLAVAYVGRGYFFYVTGTIPPHKDPTRVDEKLCSRYGVGLSKWAKARRKKARRANNAYLRFGHFFVLLSTHGDGPFFAEEGGSVRDCRKTPVRFMGYAVSYRGGHAHVRIDQTRYLEVKSYLLGIAPHRPAGDLVAEVRRALPFEGYAPVRSQRLCIVRAVNRARSAAGLEPIPLVGLFRRRRPVKPFAPVPDRDAA